MTVQPMKHKNPRYEIVRIDSDPGVIWVVCYMVDCTRQEMIDETLRRYRETGVEHLTYQVFDLPERMWSQYNRKGGCMIFESGNDGRGVDYRGVPGFNWPEGFEMSWKKVAERLEAGEDVMMRPKGNSMVPRIKSGELVRIQPVDRESVRVDTIVLAKVRGRYWLHKVMKINWVSGGNHKVEIGNQRGHSNGWTTMDKVVGWVPDR